MNKRKQHSEYNLCDAGNNQKRVDNDDRHDDDDKDGDSFGDEELIEEKLVETQKQLALEQ